MRMLFFVRDLLLGAALLVAGCDPSTDDQDGGRTDATADSGWSVATCVPASDPPELGITRFCPSVDYAVANVLFDGGVELEHVDAGWHHCDDAGTPGAGECYEWERGWSIVLSCPEWEICTYGGREDGCYHCAPWSGDPRGLVP